MKILLIEDDEKIATFLSDRFSEVDFSFDMARDGIAGLEMALRDSYDVMVIDIMLPLLDGLTIIKKVRGKGIATPILVLSAKHSVEDRIKGLETGSDDYLIKPFSFKELLARIRALHRRAGGEKEKTKIIVSDLEIDLVKREVKRGCKEINLLPKEFVLLEYLARNSGRILTRTQILEHVWGYQFDPLTNILDVYICRLREKIETRSLPKLIHTIRGAGYVLRPEG